MLDVRLPRWFVHQSFPDRHELERREEGHLTMQSCLLISSLPPTRIKSYLLTTFWSPNQYYYLCPNIETPRLCHHQCLLARLVTTAHCTPVVTSSSPTWSQSHQCFIVSVFYVLSTAISALVHNYSVQIIPLPGLYFVSPGPVWHRGMKGLRLVWGPWVLLSLWHPDNGPQLPPVWDKARASGHSWGWAPLKGWKHSRCADSDNSLGRPGRVYAAGPNMGGVGISGLTTTVYNNTGSQWGNISRHFSVILCQVRPVTITVITILITWARLSPCATLEKVWCHHSQKAQAVTNSSLSNSMSYTSRLTFCKLRHESKVTSSCFNLFWGVFYPDKLQ